MKEVIKHYKFPKLKYKAGSFLYGINSDLEDNTIIKFLITGYNYNFTDQKCDVIFNLVEFPITKSELIRKTVYINNLDEDVVYTVNNSGFKMKILSSVKECKSWKNERILKQIEELKLKILKND